MKLSLYCTCGDTCQVSTPSEQLAAAAVAVWQRAHTGDGHAACDHKTAAAARRRLERAESRIAGREGGAT